MTLQPTSFYDQSKFPNSLYLIMMELEKYLANQIFRGDLTRVIYASEEYAFRQRLNLLSKNGNASIKELDLPFMSYYLTKNWDIDKRMGFPSPTAAIIGITEESLAGMPVKWMNVTMNFSFVAMFPTMASAQLAYETLLWINKPTPKQGIIEGLEYRGVELSFPIYLNIVNLDFNPSSLERQWLNSNKVYPVRFVMEVNSVMFSQRPQDANGNTFQDGAVPYITNKVILDFLSYKGSNMFWNPNNPMLEVDRIFSADPSLNGTFTLGTVTSTSVVLNWNWNSLASPLLQSTVDITLNGFSTVSRPKADKTYTWTNLTAGSLCNFTITFLYLDSTIVKYSLTVDTTPGATIGLKGMVGL